MKELLSGNEAVARGAFEAGVHFASAYPGTPSTEILENVAKYKEIHSQWSVNEKTALETAIGASFGGMRAIVAMKHVGLNVAADPLFSVGYIGAKGGLVIVTADDPGMHSSQNEQDNRNYARAAKIPMLEPSDSQEAKDFTKIAFTISEEFDTPVLLRLTTRISHSKSIVQFNDREVVPIKGYEKDIRKNLILPAHARLLHKKVEERFKKLKELSNDFKYNFIEYKDKKVGIITSGISYQYAKEAMPDASFLKISLSWPLPEELIREFAKNVQVIYIVEENDPFLETEIKAMGIDVVGKELIPEVGELNPYIVKVSLGVIQPYTPKQIETKATPRPPALCPGCPHTSVFYAINKNKLIATGDIGCYTLGALPPLSAMDTCVDMGASITNALGLEYALKKAGDNRKIVAVIGDSTFYHSGVTGIIDMIYNGSKGTVIILDNSITAMTGHQDNPGTGRTLMGDEAPIVDIENLVRGLGVKHVKVVDTYNLEEVMQTVKEESERDELSVIIARRPCMLLPEMKKKKFDKYEVDETKCTGCQMCVKIGCPAISFDKNKKKANINYDLCVGCSLCYQVCKFDAIKKV
ncbi:MAG: Indolepyruvate oxidoreductase subunit IorA [candidate division TA06 bacterium 32_111]|uniref:Indolepyruvate oxidoreductase subunit IorA n=2 Tax=Bacteria candidate phyla TaxID=1783234 RepID=A0A101I1N0_UNCT6|nr:MAG: Indolepyruvate oxidoreductase subunit IorA [candidate division TA06 bacterium 32_111]KUK86993.1 MAG: Indolepyruvate oxidoreductase subunit IorA [candidate division TA06 bacterium 34_109]HAF07260.1 indolepyruvate ferredoxin oxidoreductase subunit alpha [candidate division WOR-3 bacterium]